jgi:hypothetical protein
MKKLGPDRFSATAGEKIRITVRSVNFAINADLDPKLSPVGPVNDFMKVGELTMGNEDVTFSVDYNFPNPLPDGGKYTRTIAGPAGFIDGPVDVVQLGKEPLLTLTYTVEAAGAAVVDGAGAGAQGGGTSR